MYVCVYVCVSGNSFSDEDRCVCAGYDNGDIKMLDLRAGKLCWETNVKDGVVSVEFDRKDIAMNKLVATTLESRFVVYDLRTRHPDLGYSSLDMRAHDSTVWLGKHLPQNRDVWMTCGGNGSLNLYKYRYPDQRSVKDAEGAERGVVGDAELLNSKRIAELPIVSFDWSPDKQGLCVMSSLDQHVRVGIVSKLEKL